MVTLSSERGRALAQTPPSTVFVRKEGPYARVVTIALGEAKVAPAEVGVRASGRDRAVDLQLRISVYRSLPAVLA